MDSVRRPAVVPAPPRAAGRDPGGLPALRRRDSHGHGRGCPLGRPARPRRAVAADPRRSPRAVRRDAGAAARARRRPLAGRPGAREPRARCRCPPTPTTRPAPRCCASGTQPTWRRTATRSRNRRPTREWEDQVAALLPLLRGTTQQHARIGQLQQAPAPRRASGHRGRPVEGVLTNLEGHADYDVRRPDGRDRARLHRGRCASSDEARSLPFVLPPLLRAVERVVRDRQPLDRRYAPTSRAASPPSKARPTGSRCARTRSRSPAAAPSTSRRRPTRCTASRTSTTGRSRTCAPPTRSSGTATWCSPTLQSPRCAPSRGSSRPSKRWSGSRATRSTWPTSGWRSSTSSRATTSRGAGPTGPSSGS